MSWVGREIIRAGKRLRGNGLGKMNYTLEKTRSDPNGRSGPCPTAHRSIWLAYVRPTGQLLDIFHRYPVEQNDSDCRLAIRTRYYQCYLTYYWPTKIY